MLRLKFRTIALAWQFGPWAIAGLLFGLGATFAYYAMA
jgi:hypothetical protein